MFCFVFGVIFVNIFVPFNINRWSSDSGYNQFFRLSSYGIIVALVLLFTQFPLRQLFNISQFKVKTFILWLLIELFIISLVYIFLYGNPIGNLFNDLRFSVKYTFLGICLPYSFALFLIYYKNQTKVIEMLETQIKSPKFPQLIGFKDDKGKIQFSVRSEEVLLLESTDNYVSVMYYLNGKIQRRLLRNTLKCMESDLSNRSIIRCHRSFMVNTENVEFIHKGNKSLQLKIRNYEPMIPVSQKYLSRFIGLLSQ